MKPTLHLMPMSKERTLLTNFSIFTCGYLFSAES